VKGAEPGLLRGVVTRWCTDGGRAGEVDLARWMPRVDAADRMSVQDVGRTVLAAKKAIEEVLDATFAEAPESERERAACVAVARGWFPVGLDLVRALPAAAGRDEAAIRGVLGAWCARYLPESTESGADLGVRVDRGSDA